jgi:hypothetical protein
MAARSFRFCAICGGVGHGAGKCSLRELEERKDPFGEQARRNTYRRRPAHRDIAIAATSTQSSPRFGV